GLGVADGGVEDGVGHVLAEPAVPDVAVLVDEAGAAVEPEHPAGRVLHADVEDHGQARRPQGVHAGHLLGHVAAVELAGCRLVGAPARPRSPLRRAPGRPWGRSPGARRTTSARRGVRARGVWLPERPGGRRPAWGWGGPWGGGGVAGGTAVGVGVDSSPAKARSGTMVVAPCTPPAAAARVGGRKGPLAAGAPGCST